MARGFDGSTNAATGQQPRPADQQTSQQAASTTSVAEPEQGALRFHAEPPPAPHHPVLNASILVLGLLGAAAFGLYTWQTFGRVELKADGVEIANASQMLVDAEVLMAEAAEVDGVSLSSNQRCYFAPDPSDRGRGNRPLIRCGPIWLGLSPEEEPWLDVRTNFTIDDSSAVGTIGAIVDTTAAEPRNFTRPDDVRPIAVGPVTRPSKGFRFASGHQLLDPETLLAESEAAARAALEEPEQSGLAVSDEWRCFLNEGPEQLFGSPVLAGAALCGPARSASSDADELWFSVNAGFDDGPTFGSLVTRSVSASSFRLRALPEGARLFRPDGVEPADAATLDRPPVATDFAIAVAFTSEVDPIATGLLITDRDRVLFEGLDRVKQVGSGSESFVAPKGHDLVVASIAPQEGSIGLRGTLEVDGITRPLPRFPRLGDGGLLVIAVPEAATTVDLVAENSGRPQTISLLDGVLAPGFPLALYRPTRDSAAPLSARIEMPVGESVIIEGTVTAITWSAKDEEGAWLPEGLADLSVEIDDWSVDQPCCDVRVESVATAFTLLGPTADLDQPAVQPDDDVQPEDDTPASGAQPTFEDRREDPLAKPTRNKPPRFRVPEDLQSATLRLEVVIGLTVDDKAETITQVLEFDLDLQ